MIDLYLNMTVLNVKLTHVLTYKLGLTKHHFDTKEKNDYNIMQNAMLNKFYLLYLLLVNYLYTKGRVDLYNLYFLFRQQSFFLELNLL